MISRAIVTIAMQLSYSREYVLSEIAKNQSLHGLTRCVLGILECPNEGHGPGLSGEL